MCRYITWKPQIHPSHFFVVHSLFACACLKHNSLEFTCSHANVYILRIRTSARHCSPLTQKPPCLQCVIENKVTQFSMRRGCVCAMGNVRAENFRVNSGRRENELSKLCLTFPSPHAIDIDPSGKRLNFTSVLYVSHPRSRARANIWQMRTHARERRGEKKSKMN